ncbi:MAG: extracellular solute-binding protein [Lachnospiraceae bacterium]|nr:extracellular solute-binding protein [Lachnospiraceae bacterium]
MQKKLFHLFLLCILCLLFCTGCGREDKEQAGGGGETPVSMEEVTWEVCAELAELKANFHRYCVKKDRVYVTAMDLYRDEDNVKHMPVIGIYVLNFDGSVERQLPFSEDFESTIGMSAFDFDNEDNVYFMNPPMEEDGSKRELVKLGADGMEIARSGSNGAFDISSENIRDDFIVTGEGTAVLHSDSELYLLDEKLALTDTVKVTDGVPVWLTLSNTGELLCILQDKDKYYVQALDSQSKKLGKLHEMPMAEYQEFFAGSGDYTLFYADESGIYGYDMEQETADMRFDYMASSADIGTVPLGGEGFLGDLYKEENGTTFSVPAIYARKISDGKTRKKLTYATLYMDMDLKEAIYAFNKSQSDIEIVIRDYSSETDAAAKLNMDILTGNIPDILDLWDLSPEQFAAQNLLTDLTPFYEKDASLSVNDIQPSVLEAMKIDGKLYYISTGFLVHTLAAKTSDVGTADGWTFEELEELLSKKNKNAQFFYINEKDLLLQVMFWCQETDFVDKQTGVCSFDSEDFKKLLKICNERGTDAENWEWTEDEAVLLRKGDILFREASTELDDFKETMELFGGDVNFIGYPSSDRQGNYISFSSRIGISEKSDYKEEAWEFLRTLMSKDYQSDTMSISYLPTRQDCFLLRLGQMSLSEAQQAKYVDIVERAAKTVAHDETIMDIVQEEAAYYFAGDRSIEDTVDIIQNRVTTYVNENR